MISMARGDSGKIVVEIDPDEKRELYETLNREGLTLKAWFLRQASEYLRQRNTPTLFDPPATYSKRPGKGVRRR